LKIFWAEDLVYTSSAGLRFGKGDTAIVAFKLIGTPTDKSADADVLYYFNTGAFTVRIHGRQRGSIKAG
jgi:hypothetical protein